MGAGRPPKLGSPAEKKIKASIASHAATGLPLTSQQAVDLANEVARLLKKGRVTRAWWRSYRMRHGISLRTPRNQSHKRASAAANTAVLQAWHKHYRDVALQRKQRSKSARRDERNYEGGCFKLDRPEFARLILKSFHTLSLDPSYLQNAFRSCGLWPASEEQLLRAAAPHAAGMQADSDSDDDDDAAAVQLPENWQQLSEEDMKLWMVQWRSKTDVLSAINAVLAVPVPVTAGKPAQQNKPHRLATADYPSVTSPAWGAAKARHAAQLVAQKAVAKATSRARLAGKKAAQKIAAAAVGGTPQGGGAQAGQPPACTAPPSPYASPG